MARCILKKKQIVVIGMFKKTMYALILFLIGGIGYSSIEILWRGFTHWSMFVLGGLCFLLMSRLSVWCCEKLPFWFCCFVSTLLITGLEFVTGCIVNLALGWNVWSYNNEPLNLLGQICLGFSSLWFLLSIPANEIAYQVGTRLDKRLNQG